LILTDREIQISLDRGLISIKPRPEEKAFTSSAVDLTLDPLIAIVTEPTPALENVIDPRAEGFDAEQIMKELSTEETIGSSKGFPLEPRKLALAWTREYIEMKTETRLAARVEGKSSLARLGLVVHMTAPTIHAGFEGRIRLEMINHGAVPIRLWPGMRICQLIFETTLGTAERGYAGQFIHQTAERRRSKPRKKSA
jgi:dCTP deaminase